MARQLTLLDTPPSWQLSEATKAAGRQGVAAARASLRAALAASSQPDGAAPSAPPATPSTGTPAVRRTAA